ncbi:MAG: DUF1961 family protein [Bacteroidetes bacterium]|nr:DUF1961 family protein [Bacteroidota bacterium]
MKPSLTCNLRIFLRLASILSITTLSACNPPQEQGGNTTVGKAEEVLFREGFQDRAQDLSDSWHLEGTGTATIDDGALHLQETPEGVGLVLWHRNTFPDSMRLAFDVRFSANSGIGVFFFAANNTDGSDVLTTSDERTGAYDEYIRGEIDTYSLSLHRYWPDGRINPGSNLRRNSGFHLLDQALPDPALASGVYHHVEITKAGPTLSVKVNGVTTHTATDDGSLGPALATGKIGFRLRGDPSCIMSIDNVVVSRM